MLRSRSIASALRKILVMLFLLSVMTVAGELPAEAGTASTCNGDVCSEVTSSGGTLDRWKSVAYVGSGYKCRTAQFWLNGGLWREKSVCGSYGSLTAYIYGPYSFASGTRMCTSWVGVSGYACLTF